MASWKVLEAPTRASRCSRVLSSMPLLSHISIYQCMVVCLLATVYMKNINSYRIGELHSKLQLRLQHLPQKINSHSLDVGYHFNFCSIRKELGHYSALHASDGMIVSPFASTGVATASGASKSVSSDDSDDELGDELSLTRENVEIVLDEMRPFLAADGGNVMLSEIDGPIVRLELQGACGTCPSSSMTMKMGLEKRLKERIPEIAEVVQVIPNAPLLTIAAIEGVLDGVRPFLSIAGGKIGIVSLTGVSGLQPCVLLKMEGTAAALQSVKIEIMQRIQRHFMQSLKIDWI